MGTLAILDYSTTQQVGFLDSFFAFGAGPFYFFAAVVESRFAYKSFRGFEVDEPLRRPWILLFVAGLLHAASNLLANVLHSPTYVNPLYWVAPAFVAKHGPEIREAGLRYLGDPRFLLFGLAFWLVLRAERQAGLKVRLNLTEVLLLCATGVWVVVHAVTALEWLATAPDSASTTKQLSWALDFVLGAVLVQAILLRNSVRPLDPGIVAAPWKCYSWAIFITCMGDAGIWASAYSVIPPFFQNLTWLIWFPQVTMFALGPWWQYEAMRTASGPGAPEPDATATGTGTPSAA